MKHISPQQVYRLAREWLATPFGHGRVTFYDTAMPSIGGRPATPGDTYCTLHRVWRTFVLSRRQRRAYKAATLYVRCARKLKEKPDWHPDPATHKRAGLGVVARIRARNLNKRPSN